jgi:threonine dehydratase
MPTNAPQVKQKSVLRYGGRIVLCEATLAARELTAAELVAETGAEFVHPYNDLRVMAGQGTAAIEFLEKVPGLDFILCPVGGGGHLSGLAVAAKSLKPSIRVVGVEPLGADDALQSLRAGRLVACAEPKTVADGLLTSLGEKPFQEIQRYVDDIVTVSEESIVLAMRLIWEVMKLVVEPSGAVAYAALVAEQKLDVIGKNVGLMLTGGNLDLDRLPWISATR